MANIDLQDQFFKALENSKSFQLLASAQQAELRKGFASATDEQLIRGLEELKKDAAATSTLDEQRKKQEASLVEAAMKLKDTMKEIEKSELRESEARDAEESSMAADKMLSTLEKIPTKPKRKKFLGIF